MNLFPLHMQPRVAATMLNDAHVKCSQNELVQLISGVCEVHYGTPVLKLDGTPVYIHESHGALFRGYASYNMLDYAIQYYDECYQLLRIAGYNYSEEKHYNYMQQFVAVRDRAEWTETLDKYCLYMPSIYRDILLGTDADGDSIRYAPDTDTWVTIYRYYYAMDKTALDNDAFAYTINDVPDWLPDMMCRVRSDIQLVEK